MNELLTIRLNDVDLNAKLIKVYGKGRKERHVPFSDRTATVLHTYLIKFRKNASGDLLFPMKNGKQITQRRAHRIFSLAGEKVGIYIHPHLIRTVARRNLFEWAAILRCFKKSLGTRHYW